MNMIEKIQMMMDERGIKISDVAKGAGLPYTTVDGIFKKGYENMKLPTLRKLADFFGVSMEYLVNDEETDRTRALIKSYGTIPYLLRVKGLFVSYVLVTV